MKFKIDQEVRSIATPNNHYIVEREIDRYHIEVRHVDSIGGSDLVFKCRKSSVTPIEEQQQ